MRVFRAVEGGYASRMADWERELLARLALETEALLEAEDGAGGSGQEPTTEVGTRPRESERDHELLAALDRELGGPGVPGEAPCPPPLNPPRPHRSARVSLLRSSSCWRSSCLRPLRTPAPRWRSGR
ncbi:hypothetical protein [Actinomyces lilanjuaniae]|uniref:DUF2017 family protein n=1 Tax=Actinomyces lilanjuaniae TaxID=2321394 RepID=UPI001FAACE50|nr:hypothetical protein [Actinomyces lilanjuaniae]